MSRGAFAIVCLLSWFFYTYPSDVLTSESVDVAAVFKRHGPFPTLIAYDLSA